MITYFLLNIFVIIVLSSFLYVYPAVINLRARWITLAILVVSTAIFDTIMIAVGLFGYNPEVILRLYLGRMPIEDFAYPIVAAIFVPYFWERLGRSSEHGTY